MIHGCSPGSRDFRYMDILRVCELTMRMLEYVRDLLSPVDSVSKSGRKFPFRSRYKHIERVTERALRICAVEGGDFGIIALAAIFHDSGYYYVGEGHARKSAQIFETYIMQYVDAQAGRASGADSSQRAEHSPGAGAYPPCLLSPGAGASAQAGCAREAGVCPNLDLTSAIYRAVYSESSISRINEIISAHSNKEFPDHALSLEARILMDADLLDETGAMAVLFDCFFEAESPEYDYNSAYNRILERYIDWNEEKMTFHTNEGKRLFLKARCYVGGYICGLKDELGY